VPKDPPLPLLVGGHMKHRFRDCNFNRATIDGTPIQVVLPKEIAVPIPPASAKCTRGDSPGRWVDLGPTQPCAPPYCTGDRRQTVNYMDWVSEAHP
jgi:hypothetical protein